MALIVEIKAVPSSGRQVCKADKSGVIKCYLKSPPEGGKANAELVKFLSKKLKVRQDQVAIIAGATARKKRIKIDAEMSLEMFGDMLGLEFQKKLA